MGGGARPFCQSRIAMKGVIEVVHMHARLLANSAGQAGLQILAKLEIWQHRRWRCHFQLHAWKGRRTRTADRWMYEGGAKERGGGEIIVEGCILTCHIPGVKTVFTILNTRKRPTASMNQAPPCAYKACMCSVVGHACMHADVQQSLLEVTLPMKWMCIRRLSTASSSDPERRRASRAAWNFESIFALSRTRCLPSMNLSVCWSS